jgi:hypothetical protein
MEPHPNSFENRLADDPEFFCELIKLIYRSKKKDIPQKEPTEELKALAEKAWLLLQEWKTPPGHTKRWNIPRRLL